jgi:quercetin dioxygenase-like cupin family protein
VTQAYVLNRDEGWVGDFGPRFNIKARERETTNGFAFVEFVTVPGEEPADHTHPSEDEAFYVVEGAMTVRCGDEVFELERGGFIFLPRGVKHGYTLRGSGETRLLVVTAPPRDHSDGWDGLISSIQHTGAGVQR